MFQVKALRSSRSSSGLSEPILIDHRPGEQDGRGRRIAGDRTQPSPRPLSGAGACVIVAIVLSASVLTDHALIAPRQGFRNVQSDGFVSQTGLSVRNAAQIQIASVPASSTNAAPCACNRWALAFALCALVGSICMYHCSLGMLLASVVVGMVISVYLFLCAFVTLCNSFLTSDDVQLRFAPPAFCLLVLAEVRFSTFCHESWEREMQRPGCCECGDCFLYAAMALVSWIFTVPLAIALVVMMEPRAIAFTLQVLIFAIGFAVDSTWEKAIPWKAAYARFNAIPNVDEVISVNSWCAVAALSAASGLILLKFLITASQATAFTQGVVMYFAFHATWMMVFVNAKLVHLQKRQDDQPLFTYFKVRDSIAGPMCLTLPYLVGTSVVMRGGGFGEAADMTCPPSLWSPLFLPTAQYDFLVPSLSWARAAWTTVMACVLSSWPCSIAQSLASCLAQYPWIMAVLGGTVGLGASWGGWPPKAAYSAAIVSVCGGMPWAATWMSRRTLEGFANINQVPVVLPTWESKHMASDISELRRDLYVPLMAMQCAALVIVVSVLYAGFIQLPGRWTLQAPTEAVSGNAMVVRGQTTGIHGRRIFGVFLVYHASHNLALFLAITFSVRHSLMNVATGVDWELWLLWLVWLTVVYAATCLFKYPWYIGQRLPSPIGNVMMQIAPGLGNDIHLFKDWLFIGLCAHQAHCSKGLRSFIAHLLAVSSFAFLFLPLGALLDDRSARESFIASHWPVVVDRPTVVSDPAVEVASSPGEPADRKDVVVELFLIAQAASPRYSSRLLEEMVSQTTTAKFVLVLQNEVPQAVNAVSFLMVFGGSYFVIVAVLMSCIKIFVIPVIRDSLPLLLPSFGSSVALSRFALQSLRDRLSDRAFPGGQTALHVAAMWGGAKGVSASSQLLSEGAEGINVEDAEGRTALAIAARNGDARLARILVDFGADVTKALQYGIRESYMNIATLLLDTLGCAYDADDLMRRAIDARSVEFAEFFIGRGANLEKRSQDGLTPLLMAVNVNAWKVGLLLLRKGVDMEAKSPEGLSPLNIVAHKCDQAAADGFGGTPAHLTVSHLKRCEDLYDGVLMAARLVELKATVDRGGGKWSLLGAIGSGVPLLLRVDTKGVDKRIEGEYSLVPGVPGIENMPFWQHRKEAVWIHSESGVWHIRDIYQTRPSAHTKREHKGAPPNEHAWQHFKFQICPIVVSKL